MPRLRRYARVLTGNRDDANDLAQGKLERTGSKPGLWRGLTDMRAWLFGIMHKLHVDGARRSRLHAVTLDDALPEVPVASTQGDPLEKQDSQMALEQHPVEQKETLLPGRIEDMSYQERLLWGFIACRKKYFFRDGAPVHRE